MKQLRSILSRGLVPKSDGDKDFVAKHTLTVIDPLDDKAAEGNDKVFRGATQFFNRQKDRHGYNPGEDVDAYDPQAKYNDQSVYHNDLWKSWRFTTQYNDHPLPQPHEVAGPSPVFEGADLIIEVSKNLLSRYIKRAAADLRSNSYQQGHHAAYHDEAKNNGDKKLAAQHATRHNNLILQNNKRLTGIAQAVTKLAKKTDKKSKSNGDLGQRI